MKTTLILFFLSFKSYANKLPVPLSVDKAHEISDEDLRTSSELVPFPELQELKEKVDETRAAYSRGVEEICRWGIGRISPKMKHFWSESIKAWDEFVAAWNKYHKILAKYDETEERNHKVGIELVALSLQIVQFLDEHEQAQDAHDKALREAQKTWQEHIRVMEKLIAQNSGIQELRKESFRADEAYEAELIANFPELQWLKEEVGRTGERHAVAKKEFVDQSPKLRRLREKYEEAREEYERAEALLVAQDSELQQLWKEFDEAWIEAVPPWVEYNKVDERRERPMNRSVSGYPKLRWLRYGFVNAKEELLAQNPGLQRLFDKYDLAKTEYFSARRTELLADSDSPEFQTSSEGQIVGGEYNEGEGEDYYEAMKELLANSELQTFGEEYLITEGEHREADDEYHETKKRLVANSPELQQLLLVTGKSQERYIDARREFIDRSPEIQALKEENKRAGEEAERTRLELAARSLELQQLWERYDEIKEEHDKSETVLEALPSEQKLLWDEVEKTIAGYHKNWEVYFKASAELADQFPKLAHFWNQYIEAWEEHDEARTGLASEP